MNPDREGRPGPDGPLTRPLKQGPFFTPEFVSARKMDQLAHVMEMNRTKTEAGFRQFEGKSDSLKSEIEGELGFDGEIQSLMVKFRAST
jgi:hypothetical protein